MLCVTLTLFARPATAQDVTVASTAGPVYLGSNGAIFYDGPVLQTEAVISWVSGVFTGVWVSTAGNTALDFDKEMDVFVGYGGEVRGISYMASMMYLVMQGIDMVQVAGEVSQGPLFFKVEGYAPTQSGGLKRGIMAFGGLRTSSEIGSRTRLLMEGWVQSDTGTFGYDSALLAQGYHGFDVAVSNKTALRLGARWSAPITRVDDGRRTEVRWEVGASRSFK